MQKGQFYQVETSGKPLVPFLRRECVGTGYNAQSCHIIKSN